MISQFHVQPTVQFMSSINHTPPPPSPNNNPATQAVMKQAKLAVIMALKTTAARLADFLGAMAVSAPQIISLEPKLANPQRAYVAITLDRESRNHVDRVWFMPIETLAKASSPVPQMWVVACFRIISNVMLRLVTTIDGETRWLKTQIRIRRHYVKWGETKTQKLMLVILDATWRLYSLVLTNSPNFSKATNSLTMVLRPMSSPICNDNPSS